MITTQLNNDNFEIKYEVPANLLVPMMKILDGLVDAAKTSVRHKTIQAASKPTFNKEEYEKRLNKLRLEAVDLFSKFLSQGHDKSSAISSTYQVLKETNYNLSYDLIKNLLTKSGCFKKEFRNQK